MSRPKWAPAKLGITGAVRFSAPAPTSAGDFDPTYRAVLIYTFNGRNLVIKAAEDGILFNIVNDFSKKEDLFEFPDRGKSGSGRGRGRSSGGGRFFRAAGSLPEPFFAIKYPCQGKIVSFTMLNFRTLRRKIMARPRFGSNHDALFHFHRGKRGIDRTFSVRGRALCPRPFRAIRRTGSRGRREIARLVYPVWG